MVARDKGKLGVDSCMGEMSPDKNYNFFYNWRGQMMWSMKSCCHAFQSGIHVIHVSKGIVWPHGPVYIYCG